MMFLRAYRGVISAACLLLLAACSDSNNPPTSPDRTGDAAPPPQGPGSIVEVAQEAGDFTTLVAALQATGLDATLADEAQTFTVFAPTDAAFEVLGQETIDALLADTDRLSDILLYHVISGQAVDSGTALSLAGSTVEMASGAPVALTLRDGELFINNARVVTVDIEASNGLIHVIDAVILPPEPTVFDGTIVDAALATDDLSTLVTAVQAAGLVDVLADETQTFTVFAPTNAAFEALGADTINALLADIDALTDVLLYHVVPGAAVDSITALSLLGEQVAMANGDTVTIGVTDGALTINGATVVLADIVTSNGTVHVIDAVLTPPSPELGNLVEVATAAGNFTTLLTALDVAGLTDTLADETALFTVFAPTDDAFAALDTATLEGLLADPDALSNVLLYHVIGDQVVGSEDAIALNGSMVEMANGATVTVTVRDGALFLNESRVIAADVPASNGVIHVIDAVLVP
jgi:uncharacterized surface protein with fasciclin (FAS1) repeats